MVYENEELRLRTININAEVERGQSDIKRLRKENDHLRREIWSLRDEYDRLNKRFKSKFIEAEQAARCSQGGCSCQCNEGGCDLAHSKCNSEDSDSCDSCCCQETEEIVCNDECCSEKKIMAANDAAEDPSPTDSTKLAVIDGMSSTPPPPQSAMPSILTGIDHLSVVSEETLSNSDVANVNPGHLLGYTPSISGSQTTLPSLVGPLTPLTPIELVANELNDIQAKVPPLSYFENVLQQHMNTNLTSSSGTSSSKSGKTVIRHTNGWDYNLESPFLQKHYPANSVSPLLQKRSTAQTLTTFVPTTTVTPPPPPPSVQPSTLTTENGKSVISTTIVNSSSEIPVIETVPITTMSVNGPCGGVQTVPTGNTTNSSGCLNSNQNNIAASIDGSEQPAKHFFAPIKPKLKLNTALANQRRQPPPPPPPAVVTAPIPPTVPVPSMAPLNKAPSFTNGVMGCSSSTSITTSSNSQQLKCEPPDIYVTNGLATPYKHPLKPSVQPPPVPQRITSMATSAQTDSANLESILNDIEAISEDILAIQLEKTKSRDHLETRSTENVSRSRCADMQQGNKNSKPYRSEMNLLLSYDGDNPTIRPAVPNSNSTTTENGAENATRRTRSLERDHTDSPSPRIPDPMQPFPDNRKYIGFEHLNNAAIGGPPPPPTTLAISTATVSTSLTPRLAVTGTQTSPTITTPMGHRSHLPLSPLVTNVNIPMQNAGVKPAPPARQYPTPLNIKCAGIQRSSSVSYKSNAMNSPTSGSPILSGVHPNKSQLFSAIANAAAARRAQFRSQPTHMTRSLDTDCLLESPNEGADAISNVEEKEITETTKRKPRRVSIVCADTPADTPATPGDKPTPTVRTIQTQNSSTTSTSGSCSDLPTVMPNPALRNFKQTSHSTPNSPHSSRKHEGSPFSTSTQPPTISITPTSPLHQQHGRSSSTHGNGSPHHHQHSHSNSYPNAVATMQCHPQQLRKNSQDTIKASAAEIACAAANVVRSKCSRRHSEGTVSHSNQRSSGTSGGTNGGHHHGHHNHHHHQHSSSIVSNTNPHHSRHSHQDSNHETVASCSDRNSNSLASSRESSASFSMRSTRRKLSVSSNTGGKIPWCGCWGNGCL
ncbi:mucin-2 [Musca vetustissima]|uniref:mucin-2 n=1 Tax=Musca vetustissima TaxID=27455 RepID=UPI002AB7EE37|nr:mucin-2 [Musca vetustissima]